MYAIFLIFLSFFLILNKLKIDNENFIMIKGLYISVITLQLIIVFACNNLQKKDKTIFFNKIAKTKIRALIVFYNKLAKLVKFWMKQHNVSFLQLLSYIFWNVIYMVVHLPNLQSAPGSSVPLVQFKPKIQ